ncbi:MAG: hypothetical protein JXA30_17980 [Deltaproteobacteria bacterium]|nr:hypothetical protein [Deltaproteobacteria bacterium]
MHLPAYLLMTFFSLLFFSSVAEAKSVSYHKSWQVKKRADAIVEVLTDYNRYCDSGCRYRYPSVKQALILPYKRTNTSFYVWTFVEDVKDSEWFSHVTVKKSGNRTVIQFSMVSEKQGETLERISKRPHDPVFDSCVTRYEITEIFQEGRFLLSKLSFSAKVTISGLIALFSGAVEDGFADTGKAIIENVQKGREKR